VCSPSKIAIFGERFLTRYANAFLSYVFKVWQGISDPMEIMWFERKEYVSFVFSPTNPNIMPSF